MDQAFENYLEILFALCIILPAIYIIVTIANWKIFRKAGEPGWKALIPGYNIYIRYKITWKTSMFWLYLAFMAASTFIGGIGRNNRGAVIVASVLLVPATIILIMQVNRQARSFGHGLPFTLGLLFLTPIFTTISGFSKAKYVDPIK